jgi:hypothetical protein
MNVKYLAMILILATATPCFSADDDTIMLKAIDDTKNMMKNPSQRKEMLSTPSASSANSKVEQLVGAENMNDIYSVSADILPIILKEANGDPAKALQILQQSQRNPAEFLKNLPASEQNKVKAIADKIESDQRAKAANTSIKP